MFSTVVIAFFIMLIVFVRFKKINFKTISKLYSKEVTSDEEKNYLPYTYLLQSKGGKTLPKFIKALNNWFKIPNKKLKIFIEISEMLYISRLLMDDITDRSKIRMGKPAAHVIYGIPLTINCSLLLQIKLIEKYLKLFSPEKHPTVMRLITEHYIEHSRGKGTQLMTNEANATDNNMEMAKQKTTNEIETFFKLMQLLSNDKRDYSRLMSSLAILNQIRENYHKRSTQETNTSDQQENAGNLFKDIGKSLADTHKEIEGLGGNQELVDMLNI